MWVFVNAVVSFVNVGSIIPLEGLRMTKLGHTANGETTATYICNRKFNIPDKTVTRRHARYENCQGAVSFRNKCGLSITKPYDSSKPTCVLINSFTMTSDLYAAEYRDHELLDTMKIIAIEPHGHSQTRAGADRFTKWDTSIINFQVLDA